MWGRSTSIGERGGWLDGVEYGRQTKMGCVTHVIDALETQPGGLVQEEINYDFAVQQWNQRPPWDRKSRVVLTRSKEVTCWTFEPIVNPLVVAGDNTSRALTSKNEPVPELNIFHDEGREKGEEEVLRSVTQTLCQSPPQTPAHRNRKQYAHPKPIRGRRKCTLFCSRSCRECLPDDDPHAAKRSRPRGDR